MKLQYFVLPIALLLFLTACVDKTGKVDNVEQISTGEPVASENKKEEHEEDKETVKEATVNVQEDSGIAEEVEVQPLPSTLSELAALPPGFTEFVGLPKGENQEKVDELMKDLPDISGEPTEQQLDAYYSELLAVFQQDFKGPEELIAKMKFQSIGSPDIEDPRMQFKENLNVLVLLDASGSMNKDVGGETQMVAAKKAITGFLEGLPKEANVGLRIYGHKGTGSDTDKALSCSSSDLVYPLTPYEKGAFQASLDQAKPAGWTPIQLALNEAEKDLSTFKGENNTNIVYLVSDGVSTCNDDPVDAAKALYDSDITPIVNVIGFNMDNEGRKQLQEVAKATEGTYEDVQNAESLQKELNQAGDIAKKWADWKQNKADRLKGDRITNRLDIFGYATDEFGKLVNERQQVGFSLQYLYQTRKVLSRETYRYLVNKNMEYHKWIEEEQEQLKADLRAMNDKDYAAAIQTLEEKYIENTRD